MPRGKRNTRKSGRESERIPVGGQRQRMTVGEKDDGYVYRWVNDNPGNIERYLAGGYEFVEHDTQVGDQPSDGDHGQPVDKTVSMQVGRTRTSVNGTAYLMRIRREYFDEDQEAKREDRLETTKSMFRANPEAGQYVKEHKTSRS